jgi:uncharacterized integral membrane protein
MREFERAIGDTEDFLMRQLGSRAAREASARKLKRGAAEAFRRVRRAGLIFVLLLLALIAASAFGTGIGFFTWLIALPVIVLAAAISMMFPTRAGRAPPAPTPEAVAQVPLPTLAEKCETWLLDRCEELPRAALPAADLILGRLRHLQPALADIPAASPLHGEVRRLVGGHLPRLVDAYLALPPEARDTRSENSRRLAEGLDAVAEEMNRLCGEIDGCRATSFEIEHRFIESRYREDPSLRGG